MFIIIIVIFFSITKVIFMLWVKAMIKFIITFLKKAPLYYELSTPLIKEI